MTHFECVRVFFTDTGLFSEFSWEGPKSEIKSLKQPFWVIFNGRYNKQRDIDQRDGRETIFVLIWK